MKFPRLFLKRIIKKSGPPVHLIWFITARCNLKCSHCFYHAEIISNRDELSTEEIKKTILNLDPLLSISLTGGEPFLRSDLNEIVEFISVNKLTENLVLFTNGFNTEDIIEKSRIIARTCPENMNIAIGVSIDGYEEEHDKYRNKKGAYQNAVNTINELKSLSKENKNLRVGIGITLHSGNQHIISGLRKDLYDRFQIIPGITMIRGDAKNGELKDVDYGIYQQTIAQITKDRQNTSKKNLYQAILDTRETLGQKLAYETYVTKKRSYECYAGSLMAVIYENGNVFPCEMLKNYKIGNLRDFDYDLKALWKSQRAHEIRKMIKAGNCHCTYECQYTCNTLYNIKYLPYYIKNIIKQTIS